MPTGSKAVLKNYLQGARDTLIWKLDCLSERDQRLPRTPTGLNLLGIVKHALHTEVVYFGETFGREWRTPEELVSSGDPDPKPTPQRRLAGLRRETDRYRWTVRAARVTTTGVRGRAEVERAHARSFGQTEGVEPGVRERANW